MKGTVKPLYPHSKNIAKNDLKSPYQRAPRASKKVREVFLEAQRLKRVGLKAAEGWAVGMQAGAGWGAAFLRRCKTVTNGCTAKGDASFFALLGLAGKTETLT